MPYPAIPKAPSVLSDKRYPHHLEETPPLSNHQRIRTDKATTEYLIGASVYDSRTQRGTATNNHGFFSLTLPVGVVRLETSYIGYGRFSHTFQPLERDTVMEILLESGEALAEVVVTGSNDTQTRYKPLRWERLK